MDRFINHTIQNPSIYRLIYNLFICKNLLIHKTQELMMSAAVLKPAEILAAQEFIESKDSQKNLFNVQHLSNLQVTT